MVASMLSAGAPLPTGLGCHLLLCTRPSRSLPPALTFINNRVQPRHVTSCLGVYQRHRLYEQVADRLGFCDSGIGTGASRVSTSSELSQNTALPHN